MPQVQLRVPDNMLKEIDRWVDEGKFRSRSDAIKTIIAFYEEREKTRRFLEMLNKRSQDAKNKPESLVRIEDV